MAKHSLRQNELIIQICFTAPITKYVMAFYMHPINSHSFPSFCTNPISIHDIVFNMQM